jgi:hypothetical protein
MTASNTKDCFREIVGKQVKGVLFDALPVGGRGDLSDGTKTLVFDDGTGLTISSSGTYWRESANEISRAIEIARAKLKSAKRDIEDVLIAAGEKAA